MSGLSEEELLEMAMEEVAFDDQEALWRHAAIWERLGEWGSSEAVDRLVALKGKANSRWAFGESIEELVAHSLVGGWAASLGSLEEIQEELFPQLGKFKEAGFYRHERALGRKMARFAPMEVWNLLSSEPGPDSPLRGNDFALSGFVQGLAGKTELGQLMPFIQFRPVATYQFDSG